MPTTTIIYDDAGRLQGVQIQRGDGSLTGIGVGSQRWADYVAANGLPPATGTPTNKPAKIPRQLAAVIADLQNNATPADKAKLQLAIAAQFLIDHPQFAAALGIPIVGDQPNP